MNPRNYTTNPALNQYHNVKKNNMKQTNIKLLACNYIIKCKSQTKLC